MDSPQWYNSKLWQTTNQSIDGNLPKYDTFRRAASASFGNRRTGLYNTTNGNNNAKSTTAAFKVQSNKTFYYRDNNSYSSHNRSSLKSAHSIGQNSQKFYSLFHYPYTSSVRSNNNSELSFLSLYGKSYPFKRSPNQVTSKAIPIKPFNRNIINPSLYFEENGEFSSPPTKNEIMLGNLNLNRSNSTITTSTTINSTTEESGDKNSVKIEMIPTVSSFNCEDNEARDVNENEQKQKAPQNTPRLSSPTSLKSSSQCKAPIKSILKKTVPKIENGVDFYREYHQQNNQMPQKRIVSASAKLVVTNTPNSFTRKSLQSAPGKKQGVRFNTSTEVIEYRQWF